MFLIAQLLLFHTTSAIKLQLHVHLPHVTRNTSVNYCSNVVVQFLLYLSMCQYLYAFYIYIYI